MVFEDATNVLQKRIKTKIICDLMAGAFAGFCSVMANNPVDVVKTNMQGLNPEQHKTFMISFGKIMKEEGPMGFYKGVGPRMTRVIMNMALTFSIFGGIKRALVSFLGKDE